MTFGEWYAKHKDDPDDWYIGFHAGWVYIGQPKDSPIVLDQVIRKNYDTALRHYHESVVTFSDTERYCSNITNSLEMISKQLGSAYLDRVDIDKIQYRLDLLKKTQSNIVRHLINLKFVLTEPKEPKPLEDTEVREAYLSCQGKKCLILKGSVQGTAWDKEEYVKWLENEIKKIKGETWNNWRKI